MSVDAPESSADLVERLKSGETRLLGGFLGWLTSEGFLKRATAQSYWTATNQILAEAKPRTDVRQLDVAYWCRAFEQRRDDLSEETRATYQTRFRKAVELYRLWLNEPEEFQAPPTRDRLVPLHGSFHAGVNISVGGDLDANATTFTTNFDRLLEAALRRVGETPDLVPHLFPLEDGGSALLTLPHPLSRSDAERLARFVLSLATSPPARIDPPATHGTDRGMGMGM